MSDHAVVAMVGDDIRQTRCTTCDTEHEYRQGKLPASRKKTAAPLPPKPPAAIAAAAPKAQEPPAAADEPEARSADTADVPAPVAAAAQPPAHEGHVHRRLIRAVLPRVEGELPVRQAPEFTMHRAAERQMPGRNHRPGQGGPPRHGASGPGGQGQRHGGNRPSGGNPSGQRGGRGGFGGPGGPGGHGGHGGPRHGRPQGGPGGRKRH